MFKVVTMALFTSFASSTISHGQFKWVWFPVGKHGQPAIRALSIPFPAIISMVCHPNLTYRPTNDMTYLTGNEGQNICAVFSENAPLQS